MYIFFGFESCRDIAEETRDAGRRIPGAMRLAVIWGGITSLVLTAALLLAMPSHNPVGATVSGDGVPFILGQLSEGVQDFLLVLIASPREFFNLDRITLGVMFVIARPDRGVAKHMHDELEATGAERATSAA